KLPKGDFTSPFIDSYGKLQIKDEVIHVVIQHCTNLNGWLRGLAAPEDGDTLGGVFLRGGIFSDQVLWRGVHPFVWNSAPIFYYLYCKVMLSKYVGST